MKLKKKIIKKSARKNQITIKITRTKFDNKNQMPRD